MGASFRIKPIERRATISDMEVNVDEAGGNVEAGGVDDFACRGGGDILFDGRDFSARNGDVRHAIDMICGINDMAAFDEQLVAGSLCFGSARRSEHENEASGNRQEQSSEILHGGSLFTQNDRMLRKSTQ